MQNHLRRLSALGVLALGASCGVPHARYNLQVKRVKKLEKELKDTKERHAGELGHIEAAAKHAGFEARQARTKAERLVRGMHKRLAGLRQRNAALRTERARLRRLVQGYDRYSLGIGGKEIDAALTGLRDRLRPCTAKVKGAIPRKSANAFIVVSARGRVSKVLLPQSPYPRALNRCLQKELRKLRFPKPRFGLPVVVRYKIHALLPDRPGPPGGFVSARDRKRRSCKTSADCLVSCLAPGRCCRSCNCSYIPYSKQFYPSVIRRCGRVRCKRIACPAVARKQPKAHCDKGLCVAVYKTRRSPL